MFREGQITHTPNKSEDPEQAKSLSWEALAERIKKLGYLRYPKAEFLARQAKLSGFGTEHEDAIDFFKRFGHISSYAMKKETQLAAEQEVLDDNEANETALYEKILIFDKAAAGDLKPLYDELENDLSATFKNLAASEAVVADLGGENPELPKFRDDAEFIASWAGNFRTIDLDTASDVYLRATRMEKFINDQYHLTLGQIRAKQKTDNYAEDLPGEEWKQDSQYEEKTPQTIALRMSMWENLKDIVRNFDVEFALYILMREYFAGIDRLEKQRGENDKRFEKKAEIFGKAGPIGRFFGRKDMTGKDYAHKEALEDDDLKNNH